jgi:hypothetical protein
VAFATVRTVFQHGDYDFGGDEGTEETEVTVSTRSNGETEEEKKKIFSVAPFLRVDAVTSVTSVSSDCG